MAGRRPRASRRAGRHAAKCQPRGEAIQRDGEIRRQAAIHKRESRCERQGVQHRREKSARAVAPIHSLLRQVAVRQVLRKRARYEEESDQQDPRPAVQCHGSKRNGQGVQSAQVASLTVRARCHQRHAGTEVGNSACAGTVHQKNGCVHLSNAEGHGWCSTRAQRSRSAPQRARIESSSCARSRNLFCVCCVAVLSACCEWKSVPVEVFWRQPVGILVLRVVL